MGLCCALFHWAPATFYASTPHEIYAAIEGAQAINARDDDDVTK